ANEQLQAAYEELKAAQSALFQSEKMASLGVLVAGVAHEINNPINFVSGSMPLLQENVKALLELIDDLEKMELPDEARAKLDHLKKDLEIDYVKEDLEKIIRNVATGAQRVKEIVANLRTFSRVESGEQAEVNIHEGIDSTLEILKHEYKNKIEIHRDYGDIPHLLGSPGKLNQVFMNILHNAIQAIDGTGDIYIRTMQDDDKVVIEIQDTGKGIPEDKIPKIFDPFFTTKPVGEGTGLGLSISYSIIQDHRGRLTVDSRVGQGTTFRIELPTLKESSAA
ncbi:GHKL domain-containing protein, partial [bacterium]|nr:GHKL domain-containing protein [bacterium]